MEAKGVAALAAVGLCACMHASATETLEGLAPPLPTLSCPHPTNSTFRYLFLSLDQLASRATQSNLPDFNVGCTAKLIRGLHLQRRKMPVSTKPAGNQNLAPHPPILGLPGADPS